jgi:hypothetical protein
MNEKQGETVLDPRLTWFIAIGNAMSWGRAQTEKQAIANMRRNEAAKTTEYVLWACPEEATVVDHLGGAAVSWPKPGAEPVRIKHVKPKK